MGDKKIRDNSEGKGEFLDETNRKKKVEKHYNSSPVQFGSSVYRGRPVLDRVPSTIE